MTRTGARPITSTSITPASPTPTAISPLRQRIRARTECFDERFRERDLWNIGGRMPGSLRFHARELDHFAPLLGLVGDQLAVVCRQAG
jgi:hypothetical protein